MKMNGGYAGTNPGSAIEGLPTLEEAGAVMSAVDTFHRKLHPRKPRPARELPRLLDELIAAAGRLRAVTQDADEPA